MAKKGKYVYEVASPHGSPSGQCPAVVFDPADRVCGVLESIRYATQVGSFGAEL